MNASNPATSLQGRWEIVSLDGHPTRDLHVEVRAFIEFRTGGGGAFHFAYVRGSFEYEQTGRDGHAMAELTFDAHDGAEPLCGRGDAMAADDRLAGTFVFHTGDQAKWAARREDPDEQRRAIRESG